MTVRTRFAPSPTGYLHIGGARTALFSWAYARKHGGKFILRIEDTDLERSTEESVQAILDAMQWLNLDCDEGPFYQMKRLSRYREAADAMIAKGHAYRCYCSKSELETMREEQRTRGLKPRYDGRCRNRRAPAPEVVPIIRFRNPEEGAVAWNDLVKGLISIENAELDDLVILRADGVPTYNFGVVIDDIDMNITHVIRGDDHVNNTPRQINIYRALGATLPAFGHVPMILGHDGERLSKRHGAVSVMEYLDEGYLPDALFNYLARLGWGHGDAEVFSREQFVQWFDLSNISHSPARFNPEKLLWLNQQYIRVMADAELAKLVHPILEKRGVNLETGPALERVLPLFKERADTLINLADEAMLFYGANEPAPELRAAHVTAENKPALKMLAEQLQALPEWTSSAISGAVKSTLALSKLSMPQLAVPARVCVFGRAKTPELASVLWVMGRERVVERLRRYAA